MDKISLYSSEVREILDHLKDYYNDLKCFDDDLKPSTPTVVFKHYSSVCDSVKKLICTLDNALLEDPFVDDSLPFKED